MKLGAILLFAMVAVGCASHKPPFSQVVVKPTCGREITADVVALDQVYYYNRFGSFNPAGIMYALRRDVVIDRESLDEVIESLKKEIERTPAADRPVKGKDLEKLEQLHAKFPAASSAEGERTGSRKDKSKSDGETEKVELLNKDLDAEKEPEIQIPSKEEGLDHYLAGHVKLRYDKRPRPLVLRANEEDCLQVAFTNLLEPIVDEHESMLDPERRLTHPEKRVIALADSDEPATRHASMHVNGLSLVDSIESQGANVGKNGWKGQDGKCSSTHTDFGKNLCALAAPGETRRYTWFAKKEGTYFFYSMGAPAGGEGDGGQLGLGLFGAVNVQPKGAKWYRSQVTHEDLDLARDRSKGIEGYTQFKQPILDYKARFPKSHPWKGDPILSILKCSDQNAITDQQTDLCENGGELIYSDLNAVIDIDRENNCEHMGEGNACGKPYREFTVIFHDEVTAVQAFDDIREENSPLSSLRDGMGINYGASGLGAMVVANRKKIGPARDCAECKLEEFFLTSWVNGDPAMVAGYVVDDEGHHKLRVKYPDDPSGVHHSYQGDPIRFRNIHAGPKETHVFHLHAHQWVEDKHDQFSHYLDSQTVSPGTAFSYEVHYGGSGNRNLGPGDSIFHCHLYPHFAQGMWELWRTHDVFEDGTPGLFDPKKEVDYKKNHPGMRNLPDKEIAGGTPTPAIVPLPRTAMAPMPTKEFPGYPFYLAGEIGHRPPQPPLDLEGIDDPGTLRRHIITHATVRDKGHAHGPKEMREPPSLSGSDLYNVGRTKSAEIAKRVWSQNSDEDLISLARELKTAKVEMIPSKGSSLEQAAMKFHAGKATVHGNQAVGPSDSGWSHTPYNWEAPGYPTCLPDGPCDDENGARVLFNVNGGGNISQQERGQGKPGAPFSNPCPKEWIDENGTIRSVKVRPYRAVYIQMDMAVNKSGWHDPQARFPVLENDALETLSGDRPTEPLFFRAQSGECVEFSATNLIPSNLNLDNFQVYSPTDVIGQHIHLVKFDVTSSDGSGNGWNYEDGTLAADEVRERIIAYNRHLIESAEDDKPPIPLKPRTHRLFLEGGAMYDPKGKDKRGICMGIPQDIYWDSQVSKEKIKELKKAWIKQWEDWGKFSTEKHPWCGAQTTIQRWWADPILNGKPGEKKTKDRTMRTVFTHDHFGPSSHQHHGFYAALVIEPTNSKWYFPDGRLMGGTDAQGAPEPVDGRHDGGPTHYAANIIVRDQGKACITPGKNGVVCSEALDSKGTIDIRRTSREFNLAFADFAIVYDKNNQPINPPSQIEGGLAMPILPGRIPMPEGISTKDPGTQLINYRNEPIPLRIAKQDKNKNQFVQLLESDPRSDLANVFSTSIHKGQESLNDKIFTEGVGKGRESGDPATPLLQAYEGDHVQIRLIQGAQEEQHVFTLHGAKWLAQPDSPNTGYVGAQHIGISEHFEFNDRVVEFMPVGEGKSNSKDGLKGDKQKSVDHLYSSNAVDNLWDGQWGLMRVYSRKENVPQLLRLPGNTEKTHDVLASAFVKQSLDEVLDSERLEVSDDDEATRKQDGFGQGAPNDALEAFCQSKDQQAFVRNFEVEAWLAKDLLPAGKLIYNEHFGITDPNAILFVKSDEALKLKFDRNQRPEPLILRARAGECIGVRLTNRISPERHQDGADYPATWSFNMVPPITPGLYFNQVRSSHRVGLHPQLVDYNLKTSDGAHVGLNEDSTVGPGESKTYLWYAGEIVSIGEGRKNRIEGIPHEFGAIPLQDMGDVIKHASHGAIGALIIEPQCAWWDETAFPSTAEVEVTYWKPESMSGRHGKHLKKRVCPIDEEWYKSATTKLGSVVSGKAVSTKPAENSGTLYRFKEMVLLYQDNLSLQQYGQPMPNLRNGDDSEDSGQKAFNYRTEPLWARLGASPADEPETMNHFDWSNVLSSTVSHFRCQADYAKGKYCDPETPIFTAKAGEQIRFRVVHPGGHPRQHGFTLFGHDWSLSPWIDNSKTMGWNQYSAARVGSAGGIGPGRAINIMASAGGDCGVHGDYLYRTQEGFMFGGGLWGIFRVEPAEKRTNEQQGENACKVALPKR